MTLPNNLIRLLGAALLLLHSTSADVDFDRFRRIQEKQYGLDVKDSIANTDTASPCNSTSCYRYYNENTKPYFIEQWPDVDFDTGEFYSGSVPIDNANRTLFFIFKPAENGPVDEVTIWLNGGPGCSSLFGFFQENGPISWQPGTGQRHKRNRYAWSTTTNMLWVDQPVQVGFSQGRPKAKNEYDVAKDFNDFLKNWEKLFGIENYKIYTTGESYAGRYVPYIGADMLDRNDKVHFDLSGTLLYDACIGDCGLIQLRLPTTRFVQANNNILNINQTTLDKLEKQDQDCGLGKYMDVFLQYPPPTHQPPSGTKLGPIECDTPLTFGLAWDAVNPCNNYYHITDTCPFPSNHYGRDWVLYLNRKDVKEAIHAPLDVKWEECNVLTLSQDHTPLPIEKVLPQVIEATNRVLIANGDWDALVYTNGTLLTIQNMTWNGKLGFQTKPSEDFVVPIEETVIETAPQGIMGIKHYERGLQWVETYQSGHEGPQYQPRAALMHLRWMLRRIKNL